MTDARVMELEKGFWGAAGDAGFYEEHMDEDGRCLLPVGALDKRSTISAIGQAEPWSSFEFHDVTQQTPADGVALITYRATAHRSEQDEYRALVGSVYRRVDGSWRLLVHQQTPLAD